ncbi:SdpI family protein [Salinicoccus roseus]|jgi:uncharacterized membrane protein|uniref:SdpI family protein n=2 Tax=Salinicoccus roseus TaxID=45670 RepID=UPI000F4F5547|nr:SdpI family protein [Salinicoccus roseus]RPE54511.1 putative membrane protein [Salinicoccus roseus]GGA64963.1 immunity protein SdpI [Salinicoccus roseus]
MTNIVKQTKYSLIMIGVTIITWGFALPFLPDHIPMQFTYSGEERWGTNKYLAGLFFVSLMLIVYLLGILKPKIDPERAAYSVFKNFYFISIFLTEVLIYIVSVLLALNAMGYDINIQIIIVCSIGFIFLFVGNYLPKIPTNWFVGIRNPWTITNDDVWIKIHRNTGKLYMIIGLVFLVMGMLNVINRPLIVITIIICVLYPHIHSFVMFRKNNNN